MSLRNNFESFTSQHKLRDAQEEFAQGVSQSFLACVPAFPSDRFPTSPWAMCLWSVHKHVPTLPSSFLTHSKWHVTPTTTPTLALKTRLSGRDQAC